ncbi:hypothetical protein D9M68_863720 [compost metagenome]
MVPHDKGSERWQQRSSSAATWPSPVRNSTTFWFRKVRPTGLSVRSVEKPAMYHWFSGNLPRRLAGVWIGWMAMHSAFMEISLDGGRAALTGRGPAWAMSSGNSRA